MPLPPTPAPDPRPARALQTLSAEARLRQVLAELVTTKLWISTVALAVLSLLLTLYPFIAKRPGAGDLDVFLSTQLGAGLLVSAVGAALLQILVLRVRRRYDTELGDLDTANRNDQARITAEHLASVSATISDLSARVLEHDRRTDHALIASLDSIGIAKVYAGLGEAAPTLIESLNDSSTHQILLLGVSLEDFVRPGEHADLHQAWRTVEDQIKRGHRDSSSGSLHVKVLLLDPNSAGAQLLCHDNTEAERQEKTSRLRNDVDYVARRLIQLTRLQLADVHNEVTLEVRFYRVLPQMFLCATDRRAFSHPYLVPRAGDSDQSGPVFQFELGSAMHRRVVTHFDLLWEAAVPAAQARRDFADGTDRGLHQSGISNIYTNSVRARERIIRLIESAENRIWIQGISLYPMLMSAVTRAIEDAVQRRGVDIRLLILDPDCEQAISKSYQELVATRADASVGESWERYRRDPATHRRSQLYNMIRESIRRAIEIGGPADPNRYQVRLYDSAPGSYLLLVDDRGLVEQYHYGAEPRSHRSPLELAEEMPLVEYQAEGSNLFPTDGGHRPFSFLENHFDFVFTQLSRPAQPREN